MHPQASSAVRCPARRLRIAGDGEILVRGPVVFPGYLGRGPEDTGVDAAGWLHTGDIGALDADGNLRLTGRLLTCSSPAAITYIPARWRAFSSDIPRSHTLPSSPYRTRATRRRASRMSSRPAARGGRGRAAGVLPGEVGDLQGAAPPRGAG